jgi:asparagine synthase (glutamine-hydrolysing)
MCGVGGWVDFADDLTGEAAAAQAMTDTLACRGPDDQGMWIDPHVALVHTRMAVIDVSGGRQPMVAADAEGCPLAVLTYCSEVYNFSELRTELSARGHRFTTGSDTEVVLRAYLEWGEGLVERLNGIYAFGIWDVRTERLLLVRDRIGVKPMYYRPTPHGVVFGSEPKAILAHPGVAATVDTDGLRELLSLAKTPGHAVYRGMRELRPGELAWVDRQGVHPRRYWRLAAEDHSDDLPATVDTVRGLLEDTVARQLVSDVPLCALLSGGLDSSVITALAARHLRERGGGPVRTFAVDFEGYEAGFRPDFMRDAPDAPYVRELVRHVGAEHTDVVLSTADLVDPAARAAVLAAHDLPFGRGDRDTSLFLLCRAVRQRSTVALTGESADEVFGGYRWFHDADRVDAATFPWLAMFGHIVDDGPDSASSLLDPGLLKQLNLPGYRHDSYRAGLADVPRLAGEQGLERRMREIFHLTLTRLMPLLLDRMDRMSMANALEVRVPFCDHRLIEYVFNVPWAMKTFDGREKSLLRAVARDLVPPAIVRRRKAPFPATQDPGYERALVAELAGLLDRPDAAIAPYLNVERARALVAAPAGSIEGNEARSVVELVLRLDAWLTGHRVELDLSS